MSAVFDVIVLIVQECGVSNLMFFFFLVDCQLLRVAVYCPQIRDYDTGWWMLIQFCSLVECGVNNCMIVIASLNLTLGCYETFLSK
jgi:hypothetical protein